MLKKEYPGIHDRIFARMLSEHSASYSFKYVKFSFGGSEWDGIDNGRVLFWLKVDRVLGILFYVFVLGVVSYIVLGVFGILLFN